MATGKTRRGNGEGRLALAKDKDGKPPTIQPVALLTFYPHLLSST
jgi:hypothetical protein